MCGPEKSEEHVRREAIEVQPRKLHRACCQGSIRCAAPKSPNDLFSNNFERHFAARTLIAAKTPICSPNANSLPNSSLQPKRQFAAQTPICSPNANSQPIASLQPKRQYAYLKHFRSPNACQLPNYPRGAAPQTPQGLLSGKHAMRGPVKSEGPVGRDAFELQPRKIRRACCRGSIRSAPRKVRRACSQGRNRVAAPQTQQGLLAEKHTMCGPEKPEGPVRRDAIEVWPTKLRRACCQGSIRCAAPEKYEWPVLEHI